MKLLLLSTIVAAMVAFVVFPLVLSIAHKYNIVDNPNARKLQRTPVPLLGGVVVYLGILSGVLCYYGFSPGKTLPLGMLGMTVMLVIGTWDDMRDLSVKIRFLIEVLTVAGLMMYARSYIDDFHGLWGIHQIPEWLAYPLSIIAGVGIINAFNLIDGIDGYSSGYGMFACLCFAILFFVVGKPATMAISLITMASLFPFFLHNVFGKKSKMFIGDGGTLMLGVLMTMFVFSSVSSRSKCSLMDERHLSLIAFTLAVLCIPVFDTLRVMTARISRGFSPFRPDKTHLHHLFIDMGFSHLGAAMSIIFVNACVVGIWFLSYKLGAPMDLQIYFVIALGVLVTFGFYKFMRTQQNGGGVGDDGKPVGTFIWQKAKRVGKGSHFEKGVLWAFIRNLVDGTLFTKDSAKS